VSAPALPNLSHPGKSLNLGGIRYLVNRLVYQQLYAEHEHEAGEDQDGENLQMQHVTRIVNINRLQQDIQQYKKVLFQRSRAQQPSTGMSQEEMRALKRRQIEAAVEQRKRELEENGAEHSVMLNNGSSTKSNGSALKAPESPAGAVARKGKHAEGARSGRAGVPTMVGALGDDELCAYVENMHAAEVKEVLQVPLDKLWERIDVAREAVKTAGRIDAAGDTWLSSLTRIARDALATGKFLGRSVRPGQVAAHDTDGPFRAEFIMLLWRNALQEIRARVDREAQVHTFACPWDPQAGPRWHEEFDDQLWAGREEEVRIRLRDFLIDRYPQASDRFKEKVQVAVEQIGVRPI